MRKEKATNGTEHKPRKRAGIWKRETRTVPMEGVGIVEAKVIVVSFEGHTWEVPDTKDGRHQATLKIQQVKARAADQRSVERLQAQVVAVSKRWTDEAGTLLSRAADNLFTALDHMADKPVA